MIEFLHDNFARTIASRTKALLAACAVVALVVFPSTAFAAPTFDGQSAGSTSGTTITVPHTITTGGATTVLVVFTYRGGTGSPSSITFNGVAMSAAHTNPINLDQGGNLNVYYLFDPAVGTHDIVATYSSDPDIGIVAASYTGVSSSGFPDAFNEHHYDASAVTSMDVAVTTVADNSLVVGAALGDSLPTWTAGAATIKRGSTPFVTFFEADSVKTPAGARTIAASLSAAGRGGMAAISLAPASATASPSPSITGLVRAFWLY